MSEYIIKIKTEQMEILQEALEVYIRAKLYQNTIVFEELGYSIKDASEMGKLLEGFRIENEKSFNKNEATDIYMAIRQHLSWDRLGKDPNKDERDFKNMGQCCYDPPVSKTIKITKEI